MIEKISSPPNPKKIRRTSLLVGLGAFLFCTLLYQLNPELINNMEGRLLDARFQYRGIQPSSGSVAIAAIDDRSLKLIGRWPWSRAVIAQLVDRINQAGASAIALDIVFAEPEDTQIIDSLSSNIQLPGAVIEEISKALESDSPDKRLAGKIESAGNVIGGYYFYTDDVSKQAENATLIKNAGTVQISNKAKIAAIKSKTDTFMVTDAWGVVTNLPIFSDRFLSEGYFNVKPDPDGIVRNAPLLIRFNESIYPSLAVKALAVALGNVPIIVNVEKFGISHLTIGNKVVKTDEFGHIVLNYRGPPKTIPTYSAVDILNNTIPAEAFKNRIVILGVPAIGIEDMRSTPFNPSFPGVEIQGTVLENIIQQDYLVNNNLVNLVDLGTMLGMILVLSIVLPVLKGMALRSLFASLLLLVYLTINYQLFLNQHVWVNMVYPMLAWLLACSFLLVYLGIAVERTLTSIRHAFKSYLHPGLVEQLVQHPNLLKFGGEQKNLTILFSDIRNFTGLSESLSPQQLARFLRCYMDPMTEEVFKNRGTLDKYVGDAVMAIFGAPYPSKEHPQNACRCAINMIRRLDDIKACCPELGHLFPVKVGIGIHTGDVVVGNLGSSYRFTYTVLGDGVNLTSRLESMSKIYGVNIVISETTYQKIGDQFVCRELDLVRVKGKEIPIRIYELMAVEMNEGLNSQLTLWNEALLAYRKMHWDSALEIFCKYEQQYESSVLVRLYNERIMYYKQYPPGQNWDCVYALSTK